MGSMQQGRLSLDAYRRPGGSHHAPHSLEDVSGLFGTYPVVQAGEEWFLCNPWTLVSSVQLFIHCPYYGKDRSFYISET